MKGSTPGGWFWFLGVLVLLAIGVTVASLVSHTKTLPSEPLEVAWNKDSCAECGMNVSERPFAAQLQTAGGEILSFNDPGCLFQYLSKMEPKIHAIYFHHAREDRWLPQDQAAFIKLGPSPMGYNLAAVDADTPESISLDDATQQVMSRIEGGTPSGARRP